MTTQTRDAIRWKLLSGAPTINGCLSDAQISSLSAQYDLDCSALQRLSRQLCMALSDQLHLAQPEFRTAKIKKGVGALRQAIKALQTAEALISKAGANVQEVRFLNPLPGLFHTPSEPGVSQLASFAAGAEAITDFRMFLELMARHESVIHTGTSDKRRIKDVRRTMVCVAIFNLWDEFERRITYTTDPITSKRCGPLISFVNSVVECISDPPSRLDGEMIKQELEDFIASCTEEWVSDRFPEKKVNRPT